MSSSAIVRERLARHKVPREIKFVYELPRTSTGKLAAPPSPDSARVSGEADRLDTLRRDRAASGRLGADRADRARPARPLDPPVLDPAAVGRDDPRRARAPLARPLGIRSRPAMSNGFCATRGAGSPTDELDEFDPDAGGDPACRAGPSRRARRQARGGQGAAPGSGRPRAPGPDPARESGLSPGRGVPRPGPAIAPVRGARARARRARSRARGGGDAAIPPRAPRPPPVHRSRPRDRAVA